MSRKRKRLVNSDPVAPARHPILQVRLPRLDGECVCHASAAAAAVPPFVRSRRVKRIVLFDDFRRSAAAACRKSAEDVATDISSPHRDHRLLREFQLAQAVPHDDSGSGDFGGTYVQCCNPGCLRFARCPGRRDPSADAPSHWLCSSAWSAGGDVLVAPVFRPSPSGHLELEYAAGSLVWARSRNFPWWPAMVDHCPDTEEFCWLRGEGGDDERPAHYHVSYVYGGKESDKVLRYVYLNFSIIDNSFPNSLLYSTIFKFKFRFFQQFFTGIN